MRELFTTGQVARICQTSAMTIIRYCDAGKILARKSPVTGVRRIPRDALIKFMDSYDIPLERIAEFERSRVFVVDDEAAQRELISRALQKPAGAFRAESCGSGYVAVIRIGAFQPDLVVLDLMMPGMDGFEVCRAIRRVPETRDAKVLVLTGYATEENVRKAEEAGADDWLSKPFRVEELRRKVWRLLKLETPEMK